MAKPTTSSNDSAADELSETTAGKGRPTPTRREREAANLRPLVSSDRKAASKESRARTAEARDRARIGLANGEEKYLPEKDKGPQRRYIRDYVDARFSAAEVLIPVMFAVIILTFVNEAFFQTIALFALWVFVAIAVIDWIVASQLVLRKLGDKFGRDKIQRGTRLYMATRMMQLRPMRLPKPQVKRGKYPS